MLSREVGTGDGSVSARKHVETPGTRRHSVDDDFNHDADVEDLRAMDDARRPSIARAL